VAADTAAAAAYLANHEGTGTPPGDVDAEGGDGDGDGDGDQPSGLPGRDT